MPQDTSGQVQSHVKPNFELKDFKSIFHFDRGFQPRLPEAEKSIWAQFAIFGRSFESCGQERLESERTIACSLFNI